MCCTFERLPERPSNWTEALCKGLPSWRVDPRAESWRDPLLVERLPRPLTGCPPSKETLGLGPTPGGLIPGLRPVGVMQVAGGSCDLVVKKMSEC